LMLSVRFVSLKRGTPKSRDCNVVAGRGPVKMGEIRNHSEG
jgi:hypothetical protein